MSGSCGSCKHWKPGEPGVYHQDEGWGKCTAMRTEPAEKFVQISAYDDESSLLTSKHFGCVIWEQEPISPKALK